MSTDPNTISLEVMRECFWEEMYLHGLAVFLVQLGSPEGERERGRDGGREISQHSLIEAISCHPLTGNPLTPSTWRESLRFLRTFNMDSRATCRSE